MKRQATSASGAGARRRFTAPEEMGLESTWCADLGEALPSAAEDSTMDGGGGGGRSLTDTVVAFLSASPWQSFGDMMGLVGVFTEAVVERTHSRAADNSTAVECAHLAEQCEQSLRSLTETFERQRRALQSILRKLKPRPLLDDYTASSDDDDDHAGRGGGGDAAAHSALFHRSWLHENSLGAQRLRVLELFRERFAVVARDLQRVIETARSAQKLVWQFTRELVCARMAHLTCEYTNAVCTGGLMAACDPAAICANARMMSQLANKQKWLQDRIQHEMSRGR